MNTLDFHNYRGQMKQDLVHLGVPLDANEDITCTLLTILICSQIVHNRYEKRKL